MDPTVSPEEDAPAATTADALDVGSPMAVIDFETTGMGPQHGARATEIAAVVIENGCITRHYQSLMYTGCEIPPFITHLTGITNAMLDDAPPAAQVMREVAEFTSGMPLVAHNASFDRGFWHAEMALAGLPADPAHEFACTVLLSRRVYPDAPSHSLSRLATWLGLARDGRAHRALSDAELTARLLLRLQSDCADRFTSLAGTRPHIDHALLRRLQTLPKDRLDRAFEPRPVRARRAQRTPAPHEM
jgi:DNA polymerase III subunit epsilon